MVWPTGSPNMIAPAAVLFVSWCVINQSSSPSPPYSLIITCAWQGVDHGVGVSGHLLGGSYLRRCWQPFGVCGEGLLISWIQARKMIRIVIGAVVVGLLLSHSLHETIPAQCWAQDLARGLNYIQGLHW